jgi:DNA polymerase III subunit gamma/tau
MSNEISIKKMMEKATSAQEDAAKEDYSNLPRNEFSIDDLKMYWRRFTHSMREKGEESVYLALNKQEPILTDRELITHEVDNQVLLDKLEFVKTDLLKYLRENLKNWGLQIEFKIGELNDSSVKMLTGKDRFEVLKSKNSNLISLQKMFNLDIEY